jgi:hypothetical protein
MFPPILFICCCVTSPYFTLLSFLLFLSALFNSFSLDLKLQRLHLKCPQPGIRPSLLSAPVLLSRPYPPLLSPPITSHPFHSLPFFSSRCPGLSSVPSRPVLSCMHTALPHHLHLLLHLQRLCINQSTVVSQSGSIS